MSFSTQRPVKRTPNAPRIGCTGCGLRIPLDRIVLVGDHRVLVCERCHQLDLWQVGTASSLAKGLDLLDDACKAIVEQIPRHGR
jgi:hypothetical protein